MPGESTAIQTHSSQVQEGTTQKKDALVHFSECPFNLTDNPKAALIWRATRDARESQSFASVYDDLVQAEFVLSKITDVTFSPDELKEIALDAIEKTPAPEIIDNIVVVVETDKEGETKGQFCNYPKKGIYYEQDRNGWRKSRLTPFYISKLEIAETPGDVFSHYNITLKHSGDKKEINLHHKTLDEIIHFIRHAPGKSRPNLIDDAVYNLVDTIRIKGLYKSVSQIEAAAFLMSEDGSLNYSETLSFPVNLPERNEDNLNHALDYLETGIMDFFRYGDQAKSILYWFIQAPLAYIRKKDLNLENKYLLAYNESHTGKTKLGNYCLSLWGIAAISGIFPAATTSASQLSVRFNKGTFPQVMDEAKNSLYRDDIAEKLKSCSTGIYAHERHNRDLQMEQFMAYASFYITMNFLTDPPTGLMERMIPVEFTYDMKQSDTMVREFDQQYSHERKNNAVIGAYLHDMFFSRWSEIKEILNKSDQLEIGFNLLCMLYDDINRSRPEWLVPARIDEDQLQIIGHEDVLFTHIRNELYKSLRNARIEYRNLGSLDELLDHFATMPLNILPDCIAAINTTDIRVRNSIIAEIKNKTGHEFPSTLKSMSQEGIGKHLKTTVNGKKVTLLDIPRKRFLEYFDTNFSKQLEISP